MAPLIFENDAKVARIKIRGVSNKNQSLEIRGAVSFTKDLRTVKFCSTFFCYFDAIARFDAIVKKTTLHHHT